MILLLDSTRGNELRVGLAANGRLRILAKRFDHPASSELLNTVDVLLLKHKKTARDIRGVVVASGPGPFSALRSACAQANAMSFALKIPAIGVRGALSMRELLKQGSVKLKRAKLGVPVVPFYGRLPNITRPPRR